MFIILSFCCFLFHSSYQNAIQFTKGTAILRIIKKKKPLFCGVAFLSLSVD
ncbi:secreted protein [gut metagenome]|uniref:Secreted protein n=1 Tax=gut metagenome TaxID=749906 RepID=J9GZC0_9ZZZZ